MKNCVDIFIDLERKSDNFMKQLKSSVLIVSTRTKKSMSAVLHLDIRILNQ